MHSEASSGLLFIFSHSVLSLIPLIRVHSRYTCISLSLFASFSSSRTIQIFPPYQARSRLPGFAGSLTFPQRSPWYFRGVAIRMFPNKELINWRPTWARLIAQVYAVDPLTCPRCSAQMGVLAVIIEPEEVRNDPHNLRLFDTMSIP